MGITYNNIIFINSEYNGISSGDTLYRRCKRICFHNLYHAFIGCLPGELCSDYLRGNGRTRFCFSDGKVQPVGIYGNTIHRCCTVISQEALLTTPCIFCIAVITATPGLIAVTRPFSTVATLGLSLIHVIGSAGSVTNACKSRVLEVYIMALVMFKDMPSMTVTWMSLSPITIVPSYKSDDVLYTSRMVTLPLRLAVHNASVVDLHMLCSNLRSARNMLKYTEARNIGVLNNIISIPDIHYYIFVPI